MMRSAVLLGAVGILLAPAVAAGPQPALYYLRDGPLGLLEPGTLNKTFPNTTAPSVRLVPVVNHVTEDVQVLPAEFVTLEGDPHAPNILGPVLVAVWPGPSLLLNGNLSIRAYLVNESGRLEIGNASAVLDFNASELPDPTTWGLPPVSQDPLVIADWILDRVGPAVVQPPLILNLGFVNRVVDNDTRVAVTFEIEPGSSDLPIGTGVGGTILYDNQLLSPSLVFVPWYKPNPPRAPFTPPTVPPVPPTQGGPAPTTTTTPEGSPADDKGGGGLPGPGPVLLVLGLVGVAVFARRRRR